MSAAEVLAAHSGWSETGPDVHGLMEVECFDCGARLGDDRPLIAAWEARTGHAHVEAATRGAMPAFVEALAQHQEDKLAEAGLLAEEDDPLTLSIWAQSATDDQRGEIFEAAVGAAFAASASMEGVSISAVATLSRGES